MHIKNLNGISLFFRFKNEKKKMNDKQFSKCSTLWNALSKIVDIHNESIAVISINTHSRDPMPQQTDRRRLFSESRPWIINSIAISRSHRANVGRDDLLTTHSTRYGSH